jgi:hypothetical protein
LVSSVACNVVVLTLGVGGSHPDMVDELRRLAQRRLAENQRTLVGVWFRSWIRPN